MANPPRLKLDLTDVSGRPLAEPCDVMLRHQPSGDLQVTRVPRGKGAFVDGLSGAPNGVYLVEIDPASYLGAGGFVSIAASGITPFSLTFPIDPTKVKRAVFPAFASWAGARVPGAPQPAHETPHAPVRHPRAAALLPEARRGVHIGSVRPRTRGLPHRGQAKTGRPFQVEHGPRTVNGKG